MLSKESQVAIADNSGGILGQIFCIYGGSRKRTARVGDIVKIAVKKVIANGKIKKGDKYKAIVIRCRYATVGAANSYSRCGDNAVVLLQDNFTPVGTSVFGYACREAFEGKVDSIKKIASICEEVC